MTAILRQYMSASRLGLLVVFLLAVAGPAFAYDEAMDKVMFLDPAPPRPGRVAFFPKELIPLWLQALARPEADMKRMAATQIAAAHGRGMPGLEVTAPPLLQAFNSPGQHPMVRLAAAHALVAVDASEGAPQLFESLQEGGTDLRNCVEPALARWDYAPARAVWLERLQQPAVPRRSLMLALQGLGAVREPKAAARLRELTLAPSTDPMLRLEAARSLGLVRTGGSEQDAKRLLAEKDVPARLAAAALLRFHRSDEAKNLLKQLARDAEAAVVLSALEALYEADPCLAGALGPQVCASPDATVRARTVEAMRKCPAPAYVAVLAELTNDPHPGVRIEARKALRALAGRSGYRDLVRREATRMLATSNWRTLEQMIILLTQLDEKAASPRFLELLHFERPEVLVTAGWGLRKLALPENLPKLQQIIERYLDPRFRPRTSAQYAAVELQVSQLAQALGQGRYRPAEPLLRTFVPPGGGIGDESRAAAIWALGLIHEKTAPPDASLGLLDRLTWPLLFVRQPQGHPPPDLVQALIGRMMDLRSVTDPEDYRVALMSAASLGRMKAREAEDTLRSFYGGMLSESTISNVSGWAIQQITGEPLKMGPPEPVLQRGWFLEPAE